MTTQKATRQTCKTCGKMKLETEYYRRKNGALRLDCKPCYSRYQAVQHERHKVKRAEYDRKRGSGWVRHPDVDGKYLQSDDEKFVSYLRRTYGLHIEEYTAIAEAQNNVCAICEQPDEARPKLSVDHDHATGKVRGLLCTGCNVSLGRLDDDSARLRKAADYLDDHSNNPRNYDQTWSSE